MESRTCCITRCVPHVVSSAHSSQAFTCAVWLTQEIGAIGPSSARTTSPTVISPGGRVSRYPPCRPRLVWSSPRCFRSSRICSRNFFGIRSFAARSAPSTARACGSPASRTTAFSPYFAFADSIQRSCHAASAEATPPGRRHPAILAVFAPNRRAHAWGYTARRRRSTPFTPRTASTTGRTSSSQRWLRSVTMAASGTSPWTVTTPPSTADLEIERARGRSGQQRHFHPASDREVIETRQNGRRDPEFRPLRESDDARAGALEADDVQVEHDVVQARVADVFAVDEPDPALPVGVNRRHVPFRGLPRHLLPVHHGPETLFHRGDDPNTDDARQSAEEQLPREPVVDEVARRRVFGERRPNGNDVGCPLARHARPEARGLLHLLSQDVP